MKIAAYGIPWIPIDIVKSFITTKWRILDYTKHKMEFDEVIKKNPEVIISFSPPEKLRSYRSIKWIITPGAGIDGLPVDKIRDQNQNVINCHANSGSVAEHAWALLLAVSKNLVKYDSKVRNINNWPARSQINDLNVDISNKSIGIVGYGAIGRIQEKYALAFNMQTYIFRKNPNEGQYIISELYTQVENLDFLIIACPLTPETKGMISKELIMKFPSHLIFVNVARGQIVDEIALIDALRNGDLRGAGIDVWTNSPYGKYDSGLKPAEFTDLSNLIISPHRAWVSKDSYANVAKQIAYELDLIYKNIKSKNIVDLEKGY